MVKVVPGEASSALGIIQPVSLGTATITATTADGKSASCQVAVTNGPIIRPIIIRISGDKSLQINTSKILTANIILTDYTAKEVTWTSSNSNILAFDENGASTVRHTRDTADSSFSDSVTVYGRSPGRVIITCEPIMEGEQRKASYEILVFKDPTQALQQLDKKFEKAYTTYIKEVESNLKKNKNAVPANTIDEQARILMEEDENNEGNGRLVTFTDMNTNESVKKDVYKAVAEFLVESTTEFDLSNISKTDPAKAAMQITKAICGGFDTQSFERKYGWNTVSIKGMTVGGASFRPIYYNEDLSRPVALFNSRTDQVEAVIKEYLSQLKDLENNLINEAYQEIKKEIISAGFSGLNNFTKESIQSILSPYVKAFEKTGAGNVVTAISTCVDYYNYSKQMIGLKEKDPFDLASSLTSMKFLSFETTSIEDKAVSAAMKPLEQAGKAFGTALDDFLATGEIDIGKICGNWFSNTFKGIGLSFMCPINITVYESDGTEIGYVGDDDLW